MIIIDFCGYDYWAELRAATADHGGCGKDHSSNSSTTDARWEDSARLVR